MRTLYDPASGKLVSVPDETPTTVLTTTETPTAQGAAGTLAAAAAALGSTNLYLAAASGVIQLAIVAVPAIRKLLSGEPVSVEEQAAVKAFVDSVRSGGAFQSDEWKQD